MKLWTGPQRKWKTLGTMLLFGVAGALIVGACTTPTALPSPQATVTPSASPSPAPIPTRPADGATQGTGKADKPSEGGGMATPTAALPGSPPPMPPGGGSGGTGTTGAGTAVAVMPAWQMPALLPGEIAATGRLVYVGQNMFLDTPSGRILLQGDVPRLGVPTLPGPSGEPQPTTVEPISTPKPAPPQAMPTPIDLLAVGKWRVENGQLVLTARLIQPWPAPLPPGTPPAGTATPVPPQPGQEFGTLYGQVRIGPLCPVEPCRTPQPDVYSSRSLVLQSSAGETTKIALGPDGWFKTMVKAGTYTIELTDCSFLGCKRVLPTKVTVVANEPTELKIDIDTGIR